LFGFAAQMARLKPANPHFLNQIFEPTRYHVNASFARFYSPRGTSKAHDRSIDRIAVRTFGREEVSAGAYHSSGKSFLSHEI